MAGRGRHAGLGFQVGCLLDTQPVPQVTKGGVLRRHLASAQRHGALLPLGHLAFPAHFKGGTALLDGRFLRGNLHLQTGGQCIGHQQQVARIQMHMRIAFGMHITRPGRADSARLRVDHVHMV